MHVNVCKIIIDYLCELILNAQFFSLSPIYQIKNHMKIDSLKSLIIIIYRLRNVTQKSIKI